jgi:hypothetical protein
MRLPNGAAVQASPVVPRPSPKDVDLRLNAAILALSCHRVYEKASIGGQVGEHQ